ncbi:MAG: hypothetical protein A3J10_02065 [Candidatus Sungbacteria bacterium RIFCSPLOWO2_02_FULL_54_10]|nr:MAG: hypothetical protein A2679_02040 [Candidatus Sungbacteria bacterium RIFCSPHIGHO2_01_FULL_54_26]OHA07307.1 MAG: hypothetical protein A3B34_03970 [Candidatus Sungbacteria bacterium RIFCSPLOWO2_01_FULL_54_21]OHA13404.1 MAG: hypothetical protein A3J10_02065 [Candidatus Sungbacteria bacterium RIFCSPLOWO2_02_FULL_54_10]
MFFSNDMSPQMKGRAQMLGMLLLAGLVLSSFAFAISYAVDAWDTAANRVAPRQFSVTGEGKVAVKPDLAVVTAGVVTQAAKIGETQADNAKKSNAVLAFIKQQGVQEKDIKTIGYTISPRYEYYNSPPCVSFPCPPQRPPEITGYEVRHTMEIKIRDFTKTDAILDGVVAAGANEVGSVSFTVDDPEKPRADARAEAIANAEEKARVLARSLGVRLGRATGFFENGGGYPMPMYAIDGKGGGFGGAMEAPSRAPEIAPGQQEIQSLVTITYEFR